MQAWVESLRGKFRFPKKFPHIGGECARSCRDVRPLLQPYIDRELNPAENDVFERHLVNCRECGLETSVYLDIKYELAGRRGDPDHAASCRLREFAMSLRDA